MVKRKPDRVVVHRIELQTKEREILEQAIFAQALTNLAPQLLAVIGTLSGAYMASAWLHMIAPEVFPAPPLLPDDGTTETSQTNGFIVYAKELADRRSGGLVNFLNPFTYYYDVFRSAQAGFEASQA